MDPLEQVTVQFRVVSAAELPRTNFFGSIDPYIRVYLDGNILGETQHLKNQKEPPWEEDFFFDAERTEDGCLCGVLRLELYDENRARQDEHVGTVEVDLGQLPPECFDPDAQQKTVFYDYDITYRDPKRGEKLSRQGGRPRLSVAFLGAIPSWSAMTARLEGWEEEVGLLVDEDSKQLYVPLPGGEGAGLYGGIQYLLPRAVHFKLVTTSKHHLGLHLDFKCSKARSLRVERVNYHRHRRRLLQGLRVYAEATLTNLPLSTELRRLHLVATNRRAVASYSVSETLEGAGFPADAIGPSMSYKRVCRPMGPPAALAHPASSSVYVPMSPKPPHGAMLQLDFREGGGGGSGSGSDGGRLASSLAGGSPHGTLRALTLKEGRSEGQAAGREVVYAFLTAGCETTTVITESHRKAVPFLEGDQQYVSSSELPGVFDDQRLELYDNAALVAYALETDPITSCRFAELFEPPPEEEEGDIAGRLLEAFDPDNMPQSMGSVAVMVAQQSSKMVGKVVNQLGHLVGKMGIDGDDGGGGNAISGGSDGGGGRAAVLRAFKAPLRAVKAVKLFQSSKDGAAEGDREGSNDGGASGSGRANPGRGSWGRGRGQPGGESGVGGNGAKAGSASGKERLSSMNSGNSVQSHNSVSSTGGWERSNPGGSGSARVGSNFGSGRDRAAGSGSGKNRAAGLGSGRDGPAWNGGGDGVPRSRHGSRWEKDEEEEEEDDDDGEEDNDDEAEDSDQSNGRHRRR